MLFVIKASQSGKVTFSYSIYPHNEFDPVFAEKRGIEQNQPFIAVPANESKPVLIKAIVYPVGKQTQ